MAQANRDPVPKPRIETLSDLIFGLALSIGAIALIGKPPASPGELANDILAFGFSCLVLISVWLRYTGIMSVLPMETPRLGLLNGVMLILVALEPYFFNLVTLYEHSGGPDLVTLDLASIGYSLDLGGLMLIMGFFTHTLTVEERKLIPLELLSKYRRVRNSLLFAAALFLVTIIPQFSSWTIDGIPVRFYLWILPLVVVWMSRLLDTKRR